MKKVVIIGCMFMMLTGCIGPTLFTIGGIDVTAGSVASMPVKKKILNDLQED